jgi:hypothetical protein
VVYVKAVARPLLVARPRKRSVKAVAKPVESEEQIHNEKRRRPPPRKSVKQARREHRPKSQQREMIGPNPGRHMMSQPIEASALKRGKKTRLRTRRRFEFRIDYYFRRRLNRL